MRGVTFTMRAIAMLAAGAGLLAAPIAAQDQRPAQVLVSASTNESDEAEARAKVAALQNHVDAYRSGDIDAFVATFSKDAVVRANGYVAVGREQIRALYALNFTPGAPTIRIHESGFSGENLYLRVGYVLEDGQEMCCSYSEFEITDGKVSFLVAG